MVLEIIPEFDFELLGIVSAAKDFTIACYINWYLGIELTKNEDLQYDFVKDCKFFISNFIFEADYSNIRLIKNRPVEFINLKKPYLLPELKNYDYFILLSGEYAENYAESEIKLKKVPIINLIKRINYQEIPSAENLLIY
ncbi:MAG: IPExxxVDY family protein [Bacteroidota bacterium]|nr:IPExxxVDY family protein [Bacteroidota bacterium]